MEIDKCISGVFISLDDIKDKKVKALLKKNGIEDFMVDIDDVTVDVDLADFDLDDLIDHVEGQGYEVIDKTEGDDNDSFVDSYERSLYHIDLIKQVLQKHQYDSGFIRLMLEEITGSPMGCPIKQLVRRVGEMCL